jgi:hypothetical protein
VSEQLDLSAYGGLRVAGSPVVTARAAGSTIYDAPRRLNLFAQPTPQVASGGAWGFQPGTGETQTASLVTTPGAGPEGRTKYQRRTVTAAKSAGASGIFYRETSADLAGAAGAARCAGLWVRYSHVVTATPQLMFRLGATTVTTVNGTPAAAIPANTWRYLTVSGVASAAFDGVQAWCVSAGSSVIPVGGFYDCGSVIAAAGTTVGAYFDGSFASTAAHVYAWRSAAWASVSEEVNP